MTKVCVLKYGGPISEVSHSAPIHLSISATVQWVGGKHKQGDRVNPHKTSEESSQGLGC